MQKNISTGNASFSLPLFKLGLPQLQLLRSVKFVIGMISDATIRKFPNNTYELLRPALNHKEITIFLITLIINNNVTHYNITIILWTHTKVLFTIANNNNVGIFHENNTT